MAAAACASSDSSPEPTRDPYGREGERCYSDYSCNDWLTCVSGVCRDVPYDDGGTGTPDGWTPPKDAGADAAKPKDAGISCGLWGLYCCTGGICEPGTVCNFGTGVCDACGSTGQVCCNDGVWCSTGNNCVAGSCEQCGIIGKTCCPGPNDCATGSCVQGNCQSCGTTGLICCPGQTCKGTVCKSGKCL